MDFTKICRIAKISVSEELEKSVERVLTWADELPAIRLKVPEQRKSLSKFREDIPLVSEEKEEYIIMQFAKRRDKNCIVPRSL